MAGERGPSASSGSRASSGRAYTPSSSLEPSGFSPPVDGVPCSGGGSGSADHPGAGSPATHPEEGSPPSRSYDGDGEHTASRLVPRRSCSSEGGRVQDLPRHGEGGVAPDPPRHREGVVAPEPPRRTTSSGNPSSYHSSSNSRDLSSHHSTGSLHTAPIELLQRPRTSTQSSNSGDPSHSSGGLTSWIGVPQRRRTSTASSSGAASLGILDLFQPGNITARPAAAAAATGSIQSTAGDSLSGTGRDARHPEGFRGRYGGTGRGDPRLVAVHRKDEEQRGRQQQPG